MRLGTRPASRCYRFAKHLVLMTIIASTSGCDSLSPQNGAIRWEQLAAGMWRTCGIEAATGAVYCWGGPEGRRISSNMQTADSETPMTAVPLALPGGACMAAISVGEVPICALTSSGEALCAGWNTRGEVGDGTTVDRRGFRPVAGGYRWQSLATSSSHVCALRLDGQAYCWGNGFRGKLGNGTGGGNSIVPTRVLTEATFTTLAAGEGHTCGLDTGGHAWCWGVNDYGQLGDGAVPAPGTGRRSDVPSRVVGEQVFVELFAGGGSHSCVLDIDRRAYCWGFNSFGQLGIGSTDHISVPTAITANLRWKTLIVGESHTCGTNQSDDLYCWGSNSAGQFGDGTTLSSLVPRLVQSAKGYRSVISGGRHMCAVTTAGRAVCWGRGTQSQLGNGAFVDQLRPSAVAGETR